MAKKKLTPLQREYGKQRKRIQQAIKRAEKRGYILEKEILPQIPKKITTQSVKRLSKIDTNKIYENSVKLDTETGEITPGKVARKQERSEAAKKAARTRKEVRYNPVKQEPEQYELPSYTSFPSEADIVIQNFKADVVSRFPEVAAPILSDWLNRLLSLYDKEDVTQMLQDSADAGVTIDYSVSYNEEALLSRIADMMDYLPGASTGMKSEIMDALEFEEDWELPD